MKRKSLIITLIVSFVILAIVGGWYYYYNYVETVTEYCLIKVTPPQEEHSIFGGTTYSKPKLEFELINKVYASDSIAVADQKKGKEDTDEFLLKELENLDQKSPHGSDDISYIARLNALSSMLSRYYVLVRVTHTRNFSPEEVMNMLQEHWADKTLEEYAKNHKVEVAIYNI